MKDANTFKDIKDIIIGIGEAWSSLSDIEQASLGEALAGKRNANALFAVLNNIDTVKEAYDAAENSAGSAMREQENYAQSLQYSLDVVKASAQELTVDFLSSDFLKGLVDTGNDAINVVDKLITSLHGIPAILSTIFATVSTFKGGGISNTKSIPVGICLRVV